MLDISKTLAPGNRQYYVSLSLRKMQLTFKFSHTFSVIYLCPFSCPDLMCVAFLLYNLTLPTRSKRSSRNVLVSNFFRVPWKVIMPAAG